MELNSHKSVSSYRLHISLFEANKYYIYDNKLLKFYSIFKKLHLKNYENIEFF